MSRFYYREDTKIYIKDFNVEKKGFFNKFRKEL